MCLIDSTAIRWLREVLCRGSWQKTVLPYLIIALVTPVGAEAQRADDPAACPKIAVPPEATVIGVGFSVGQAMADVYIGDPNAPLSVVDVEIEAGDGPIFVVGASENAAVWRFSGDTRRVAGGLFIGNRSMVTKRPASAAVVGLKPELVTIPPPGSCPLTRRLFAEITDRDIDAIPMWVPTSKIALPSGRIARTGDNAFYRYPGEANPDLEPEAARLWLEFLAYFPGGLVAIDPAGVVSLQPVKKYEQLPGLLGLAQLVSDGTLQLTGTPDGLRNWWGELGKDWVNINFDARLRTYYYTEAHAGNLTAPTAEDLRWLRTPLARASYYNASNDPVGPLHGNHYRINGGAVLVENDSGDWIELNGLAFLIRAPFILPPALPAATNSPIFLLPKGIPEPTGPFRRELPLLSEAVD